MNLIPKILIITARADFGGGPEHIYNLVNRLKDEVEFYIACPDDYPYKERYTELISGKKIIIIPHRKFVLKDLFRLQNFIREHKIKIIHSHGKGAGIYSRILSLLTSVPCIHTFHGIHTGGYNSFQKYIYLFLEKFFSLFTKQFISVSKSEFQQITANRITSPNKIVIIENAVRIPDQIIPDSNFYSEKKKIITITRFDYAKNSLLLIPIFNELKAANIIGNFELILIGSGEEVEELKKESKLAGIENIFSFEGMVNNPADFLADSFCYLSTSRWEAMPLGVMEAMSFGIPVIATSVTGNIDLIDHNQTGFLFNINNPKEAAEYIIQLSKDYNLWKKFSLSSREKIENNFSITKMAEKTKNIYTQISL